MEFKTINNLYPPFEVAGLLYCSENYDEYKKGGIAELNNRDINGEAYWKKELKIFDKYLNEFNKNKRLEEEEKIFFVTDLTVLSCISQIVFYHDNLMSIEEGLDYIKSVEEEELRRRTIEALIDNFEVDIDEDFNNKYLVDILKSIPVEDKSKWVLMVILSDIKKYCTSFLEVLNKNMDAYLIALKKVEKPLEKLLGSYRNSTIEDKKKVFVGFEEYIKDLIIIPSLVFPLSILATNSLCFYGLLSEKANEDFSKANGNKGDLIVKLKVLSDKSKLEIMTLLKEKSMYSQEIAEALKLTPATVSYHMNYLTEVGMLYIEKIDGKMYYSVNRTVVNKFIEDLRNLLL